MFPERRSCVRHKVHGPVFASFDGVTGGMILDLSEQGLSMQTVGRLPVEGTDRRLHLRLDLPDSEGQLEMSAYVAWADALGRAGIRFSDLPEEATQRLDHWLAANDQAITRKAPKLTVDRVLGAAAVSNSGSNGKPRSISLEADLPYDSSSHATNTIQFEFHSLGADLNVALRVISERAKTLLRGTGAAIALSDGGPMMCRASIGKGVPPLGTHLDVNSGFSGECARIGKALRCDDTETDPRVCSETCRRLGIRSIAAAPIRYERSVVGLLEVFSADTFAFDEGDLAVLERLAQTVLLTLCQSARPVT